jgi:thiol-disulfide isomerase/thioredoxin
MRRREFTAGAMAAAVGSLLAAPTRAAAPTGAPAASIPTVDAAGVRKLLDARRGKVIVLNLWATWCAPCLREIPDLVRLEAELAPRGVALIGVSMDEPDDGARVAEFRAKYFPAFPTWLRSERELDAIASVVDPAWNEVLPTTYLLGRDGKVARRVQGAKTHEEFRALIEAVLAAGARAG